MQLVPVNAIFQVSPIFVTILSAIVLKEYVDIRRWTGVIIGMLGALIIIGPGSDVFAITMFFPAIAALCYASFVISTRYLSQGEAAGTSYILDSNKHGRPVCIFRLWFVWSLGTSFAHICAQIE